jgi:uncharacterized protein (TIGR03435 family)
MKALGAQVGHPSSLPRRAWRRAGLATLRPPSVTPAASDVPSLFTAIQEQLGLKLQPSRIVRDTLIIDHVERPTPN